MRETAEQPERTTSPQARKTSESSSGQTESDKTLHGEAVEQAGSKVGEPERERFEAQTKYFQDWYAANYGQIAATSSWVVRAQKAFDAGVAWQAARSAQPAQPQPKEKP